MSDHFFLMVCDKLCEFISSMNLKLVTVILRTPEENVMRHNRMSQLLLLNFCLDSWLRFYILQVFFNAKRLLSVHNSLLFMVQFFSLSFRELSIFICHRQFLKLTLSDKQHTSSASVDFYAFTISILLCIRHIAISAFFNYQRSQPFLVNKTNNLTTNHNLSLCIWLLYMFLNLKRLFSSVHFSLHR